MKNKVSVFALSVLLLAALATPALAGKGEKSTKSVEKAERKLAVLAGKLEVLERLGIDVSQAKDVLNQVSALIEEARRLAREGALEKATDLADKALSKLDEVEDLIEGLEGKIKEVKGKAEEEVGKTERLARGLKEALGKHRGRMAEEALAMVERIREQIERAREELRAENYSGFVALMKQVREIAGEAAKRSKALDRVKELEERLGRRGLSVARERLERIRERLTSRLEEELAEELEELKVERTAEKFKVESPDSELEFKLTKPELELKYRTPTGEGKLEVKLEELVEFVDLNNDCRLGKGEEVATLRLGEVAWNAEVSSYVDSETNTTSYKVVYAGETEAGGVTFVMHVYQASTAQVDGGADEVKIDVALRGWRWHNDTSLIALVAEVKAKLESPRVELANLTLYAERGMYLPIAGKVFAKYEWVEEISVDGAKASVVNCYAKKAELEKEEGEVEAKLELLTIYPHFASELRHDPSVGVEDDPDDVYLIGELAGIPMPPFLPLPLNLELILALVAAVAAATGVVVGLRVRQLPRLPL